MRSPLLFVLLIFTNGAFASLCNPAVQKCWGKGNASNSSPAYPSKSSNIKINPSAVPIEKSWGAEALHYDGSFDFALVRGTGRVGAAISPSNGEETFFGPMGFEEEDIYLERMIEAEKYESQKYTLATAFGIWGNKKGGLKRVQFNLGLIAKYNAESEDLSPGGGMTIVAGPLTLGYSTSQDNYLIDRPEFELKYNYKYRIETLSAGIYLNSVAIDYSHMRIIPDDTPDDVSTISLLTSSLILKRWILTAANRRESSNRADYDFKTKSLKYHREKIENFGGVQFSVTKVLMLGVFHNYYLLREISVGATLFF